MSLWPVRISLGLPMTSRCGGVTNEPRRRQCASGSTSQRAAPSALRTAWSESVAAAPCICAHPALSRVMCRPTACGDREGPMAAELGVGNVFEARRHGWHEGWGRSLSLRFPCICSQRIDGELHPSQNTRNTLRSMSAGKSAWMTGSARSAGFATVRPYRREGGRTAGGMPWSVRARQLRAAPTRHHCVQPVAGRQG